MNLYRNLYHPLYQTYPWDNQKNFFFQPEKLNFAMKMDHVRLSSSHHNHLYFRCVLQNIWDRSEDILVFHAKRSKLKHSSMEIPWFCSISTYLSTYPLNIECKLNMYNIFRRRPGCLLIICVFWTSYIRSIYVPWTAWKASVCGVFLVRIFLIWTKYGEIRSISLYSVQMRENPDQKNSEYGQFSRSDVKEGVC